VFVPTLAGTPGEGRKLTNALAEKADTEAEVFDLLALVDALGSVAGIDSKRIGIVGVGHGGALALALAGSQPGMVQVVAAVDPLCDWNAEFDHATHSMRDWIVSNIGLPATNQGRIAVRTPATWAGIIDAPLLLMGTERASAGRASQLDGLTATLRELDRSFEHDVSVAEPEWDAARRVASFIRSHLDAVSTERELVAEGASADVV
jgi:dienelactone hydrolase